jgi:hypothetical protein
MRCDLDHPWRRPPLALSTHEGRQAHKPTDRLAAVYTRSNGFHPASFVIPGLISSRPAALAFFDCEPDVEARPGRQVVKAQRRKKADHAVRHAYARFGQGMMLGDLSGIGHHAETATGAAEDATPLQPPQGSALIPSARTSRGPKGPPWRTRSIRRSAWVSATCASRMLDNPRSWKYSAVKRCCPSKIADTEPGLSGSVSAFLSSGGLSVF